MTDALSLHIATALDYLQGVLDQLEATPVTLDHDAADALAAVTYLHRASVSLAKAEPMLIAYARERTVSWPQIAAVYEVTPQAVQQRFGRPERLPADDRVEP